MKFIHRNSESIASESDSQPKSSTEDALWLDSAPTSKPSQHRWHTAIISGVVVACLALAAIPVVLVLTSKSSSNGPSQHVSNGSAQHRVLQALSATTNSGSFDMTYKIVTTPAQASTNQSTCQTTQSTQSTQSTINSTLPPTTTNCPKNAVQNLIFGVATVDTSPFAMKATAQMRGNQILTTSGTFLVNTTTVFLYTSSPNYSSSTTSNTSASPGSPGQLSKSDGISLPSLSNEIDAPLGTQTGSIAILGLANPTGFLELGQNELSGATAIGTGTIAGEQVKKYKVSENLAQLIDLPGLSSAEISAIKQASANLERVGYQSTSVELSIDQKGYILQSDAVSSFSNGITTSLSVTLSNFGCAGNVAFQSQQGGYTQPSNCSTTPSTSTPSSTSTAPPTTSSSTTSTTATAIRTPVQTTLPTTPQTVPPTTVPSTTVPPTTSTTRPPNTPVSSTTSTTYRTYVYPTSSTT